MKLTELGVSQRECYEICPALWYYQHILGTRHWGVVPRTTSLALDWGRIGHLALQAWYESLKAGATPEEATHQAKTAARSQVPSESNDLALVESFVDGYSSWYASDPNRWDILATEWGFCLPAQQFYGEEIAGSASGAFSVDELPMTRGTVDLIVRDRQSGAYLVVDHKFHKTIDVQLDIKIDWWYQPQIYTRAFNLIWQPDGPVYYLHNQIRKPADGLKPKKQRDGQLESIDDFLERLRLEYITYPDFTEEYPNNKKGYFHRSEPLAIEAKPQLLLEMALLDAEMTSVANTIQPDKPWGPKPVWIRRRSSKISCQKYGRICDYAPLCAYGISPATLEPFEERSEVHP